MSDQWSEHALIMAELGVEEAQARLDATVAMHGRRSAFDVEFGYARHVGTQTDGNTQKGGAQSDGTQNGGAQHSGTRNGNTQNDGTRHGGGRTADTAADKPSTRPPPELPRYVPEIFHHLLQNTPLPRVEYDIPSLEIELDLQRWMLNHHERRSYETQMKITELSYCIERARADL